MMQVNRTDRKELDALSKDIFGVSSRWQKLVEKGYSELVTEEKTETVPAEKEGDEPTTRQVKVPILTSFGAKQYVIKRHTLESVKEFLLEQKTQLDNIRAQIKKHQEEQKAKEDAENRAKQIHEQVAGSANG